VEAIVMRRLYFLLLSAVVVASGCPLLQTITSGGRAPAVPVPSRKLQFEAKAVRVEYPNGLEIFIAPDSASELTQIDLRFDIGAREDPPDKSGLAHLAEHLAFELTTGGPPIERRLGAAALGFNAHTDADTTHFSTTALPTAIAPILAVYADLLRGDCTGLTDEVVGRGRHVVYNELRLRTDLQKVDVYDLLLKAIYPADDPYGSGIGGSYDSLAAIDAQDVCAHFQGRFVPRRASVVITGKVDPGAVQRISASILRPLPSRVPTARANVSQWSGKGERRRVEVPEILPALALVFPFPSRFSPDDIPAQFIKVFLDIAVADLRGEEGVAAAWTAVLGGRDAPTLILAAAPEPGHDLAFIEKKLWQTIGSAQALAWQDGSRELLSQQLRKSLIHRLEPLESRANAYADYLGNPEYGYFGGDLNRIVGAQGRQVLQAANTIFARETALTLELQPRSPTKLPTPLSEWLSPAAHSPEVTPPGLNRLREVVRDASANDALEELRLDNGLRVILAPGASMPVVDLRLVVLAGHAHAPASMRSLATLSAHLGTVALTGSKVVDLLNFYATGGNLDIEVSSNTTVFSTTGLNVHVDRHLRGLSTSVLQQDYQQEELARLREALERHKTREARRTRRGLPADLDRLVRAILGGQSCGELAPPSSDELAGYTVENLRDFKDRHVRANNSVLIVAGKYDRASIIQQIEQSFGARAPSASASAWNSEGSPSSTYAAPRAPLKGPRVLLEEDASRKQLHVVIGYALPPELRSRNTQALVGAMVEEAAQRVRTRLGASYSFSVGLLSKCGADLLLLRGDVEAARAVQAMALLRAELTALRAGEGLAERLARAQQQTVHKLLAQTGDSRQNAENVVEALRRGAPVRTLRALAGDALVIDVDSVRWALQATLGDENEAMLCVGATALAQEACGASR
jgi:predicted Zn-dependent peptidase